MISSLSQETSTKEEVRKEAQNLANILQFTPWMYHYFKYQKLVESIVAHSGEDTSKTLFGNFKSSLLHSWEQPRTQWTKGNAHIAHAALVLFQAVKHEIPGLKVSVERNQKLLQTIHAKSVDLRNHIDSETKTYLGLFEKHGILPPQDGEAISVSELETKLFHDLTTVLSNALPVDAQRLHDSFTKSLRLINALEYYKAWTNAWQQGLELKAIYELLEQGYGPLLPSDNSNTGTIEPVVENSGTIDEDTIDWGDYDFDMSSSSAAIDIVDAASLAKSHLQFRRTLATELQMLMAFFRQRLNELSSKNDFLDLVMGRALSKLPEVVRSQDDAQSISNFVDGVQGAIDAFNEFLKKVDLLESETSRSEVVSSLIAKRSKIGMLDRTLAGMRAKRAEIEQSLAQVSSKAQIAKNEITELQQSLESELSRLCKGRTVTITIPKIDV